MRGHFIGLEVAKCFDDFQHDIPAQYDVKAPTEEVANQIREIIVTLEEPTSDAQGEWWSDVTG